jgi:hypothetical protein
MARPRENSQRQFQGFFDLWCRSRLQQDEWGNRRVGQYSEETLEVPLHEMLKLVPAGTTENSPPFPTVGL